MKSKFHYLSGKVFGIILHGRDKTIIDVESGNAVDTAAISLCGCSYRLRIQLQSSRTP